MEKAHTHQWFPWTKTPARHPVKAAQGSEAEPWVGRKHLAAARLSRGQPDPGLWLRLSNGGIRPCNSIHAAHIHGPVGAGSGGGGVWRGRAGCIQAQSLRPEGRWGAGIIFSHFTLSELAFGWKNHPQGTLWAVTPLITQGHSLLQVPLETRDSRGGTLRASLPDSAAGRAGVSRLLGLLQPCNLLSPLQRLGGGSVAQRVCKAAVSPEPRHSTSSARRQEGLLLECLLSPEAGPGQRATPRDVNPDWIQEAAASPRPILLRLGLRNTRETSPCRWR